MINNVKDFLADERFLSAESRCGKNHSNVEIRELTGSMLMRRAVMCSDGFALSIQYSSGHYCNGREPFLGGEWTGKGTPLPEPKTVELGFPSKREPVLRAWAEEWSTPLFGQPYNHSYGSWSYRWREWAKKYLPLLAKDNSTDTVYAYVPIDLVDYVLQRHGGITHVRSDSFETWEPI